MRREGGGHPSSEITPSRSYELTVILFSAPAGTGGKICTYTYALPSPGAHNQPTYLTRQQTVTCQPAVTSMSQPTEDGLPSYRAQSGDRTALIE